MVQEIVRVFIHLTLLLLIIVLFELEFDILVILLSVNGIATLEELPRSLRLHHAIDVLNVENVGPLYLILVGLIGMRLIVLASNLLRPGGSMLIRSER